MLLLQCCFCVCCTLKSSRILVAEPEAACLLLGAAAERARLPEPRHEPAAEVEPHEPLQPSDGRAADEERRHGTVARRLGRGGQLLASVVLDDGGVRAHGGEEPLHDVRHVAPPAREDDNGRLADQADHALRRRLLVPRRVDGQAAPDANCLHPPPN
jgi:hypothetical protein